MDDPSSRGASCPTPPPSRQHGDPRPAQMIRAGLKLCTAGALLSALFLASTLPASADEGLEIQLAVEERLLEAELERYRDARKTEREALSELDDLERRLDRALGNAGTIEELWTLHSRISEVRDRVVSRTREVNSRRALLLTAMERVTELGGALAEQDRRNLATRHPVEGLWRLTIEPVGLGGWISLKTEGTLVTGNYRLDTGETGSVAGTLSGSNLQLQRFDSVAGFDATLEGVYDSSVDEVRGVWQGTEVSAGISTGTWSTVREDSLEPDDVLAPQ